ncbi:MAG: hypothetical protein HYY64_10655 [Candidatus Rokubacteria bacterium]|nr:hypothetical protein [Candidatus Rokubacteria bacterium]
MDRKRRALARILVGAGFVLGMTSGAHPGQPSGFGDPLPGLTADEEARFHAGKALFEKVFTPRTGLGPLFNGVSCAECHSHPTAGGSSTVGLGSDIFETRFRVTTSTTFLVDVVLQPEGAPVIMNRTVADEFPAEVPGCALRPEVLPPSTVAVSFRNTAPIFGGGLIEAIPDETILANAEAEDAGICGSGPGGRRKHGGPDRRLSAVSGPTPPGEDHRTGARGRGHLQTDWLCRLPHPGAEDRSPSGCRPRLQGCPPLLRPADPRHGAGTGGWSGRGVRDVARVADHTPMGGRDLRQTVAS